MNLGLEKCIRAWFCNETGIDMDKSIVSEQLSHQYLANLQASSELFNKARLSNVA